MSCTNPKGESRLEHGLLKTRAESCVPGKPLNWLETVTLGRKLQNLLEEGDVCNGHLILPVVPPVTLFGGKRETSTSFARSAHFSPRTQPTSIEKQRKSILTYEILFHV